MNPGCCFSRPDHVYSPSGIPATDKKTRDNYSTFFPPAISLPGSWGAIRAMGEKFSVNAVNGSAGYSIYGEDSEIFVFSGAEDLIYGGYKLSHFLPGDKDK
ncbi:MAG: hypothetical protein Q8926_17690 [Bacteroidota bacterium]|nr:hypothetical protein [Bacteroidota bacterium]